MNPNITWENVEENPNKPWNYTYLSRNKHMTQDVIQNNIKKKMGLDIFIYESKYHMGFCPAKY